MSDGGHHKKKGGHEESSGENVPLWYVSFSDMMAVLMSMFVMLYSMSNLDTNKFQEVVVSLNGAWGVLSGGPGVLYLADLPTNMNPDDPTVQLSPLYVIQQKYAKPLEKQGAEGRIDTELTSQGLRMRFTDRTLFAPGSATLRPEAAEVMSAVGELLRNAPNRITVEGHTDSTPISTAMFPSNWELSTARATAVIHYLIENEGIAPKRLTAAGYGEFWPLVPNDTPERRAYNRRVEITLLSEEEHVTGPAPAGTAGTPGTGTAPHTVDLLALPDDLTDPGQPDEKSTTESGHDNRSGQDATGDHSPQEAEHGGH